MITEEEKPAPRRGARSGGRAARQALRSAPIAAHKRPVRAGLEGGAYRPLSEAAVRQIHEAALDVLETIGLCNAPESGIEILTGAGAILGEDERIRFPRALVEDSLAIAARNITLCGRDERHDLTLSGNRVHFGTAGAAVHVVDVENREYRESTLADLLTAARLVDGLDNIHFFQRCLVARDLEDPIELDLNTVYASCSGTTKHIGTSFMEAATAEATVPLLHMLAGGEAEWRRRPFLSNSNCFVVPPLTFAPESCQVMETCIRAGMPVLLLSAGQAGATAPAPLATAIVQAVAECLAGVVYVNAIAP
ncbi:MAG: trimethylamine methyltransferase family protein, partial [Pseudomonadota bacterium]